MTVPEEECSSVQSRSSSSPGSYYLAKSVLKSGVILHVLSGHLRSPSSLDIVFGKETTIELVVIGQDGALQSVCEQAVFGAIKDINILHYNERFHGNNSHMMGRDALVVLSDSGKLSFLTFCNEMHRFFPVTHVQISNPGNSIHQLGRMLAVDSSGCFVACSAYAYRLALFSISNGAGADFVDKKICYPSESEGLIAGCGIKKTSICGTIWSMCFISKDVTMCSGPLLALLVNRIGTDWNELLLLGWNLLEANVHLLSEFRDVGPLAYSIAEVPHHGAFAILFRLGDMLLMDLTDPYNPRCICKTTFSSLLTGIEEQIFVEETSRLHEGDDEGIFSVAARALLELKDHGMDLNKDDDPMNIDDESGILKSSSMHVCAWSWEPTNKTISKLVLCTDSGAYFMVELSFDSSDAKLDMSECLYRGQPSKALLWVEGDFLVAIVDMGDGMILKYENEKLIYRNSIQNIAPVLDMFVVDCHDEKHGQMFACCGVAPQGSLRLIRSGVSVDKLLETPPVYQGVTGMWTMKMKANDLYHSFLVISFVEETRVLSVGLSFNDISDSVGFLPDVCTLGCGLIGNGLLVQIHRSAVTLCLPTNAAHPDGIPLPSPVSSSWQPENTSISVGSVGLNLVVVATSSPCFLIVLGVRFLSAFQYEIYEKQQVRVLNEISCISIPQEQFVNKQDYLHSSKLDNSATAALPDGVDISSSFAIGTHKPSVEVLLFTSETGLKVLAEGIIMLMNTTGAALSGCVPQDVRLVFVDHLYVLSGLRNGMLLRFEWPASICTSICQSYCGKSYATSLFPGACNGTAHRNFNVPTSSDIVNNKFPVSLQSTATRRIGVTPVFLIPLNNSLDADIIALSDRPWLLQTARHSLSYTSISFRPSTHATAVCFDECPKGVFFVAENRLHLVEMMQSKRLNVQKFHLGGTPRKVLYHGEGRLLLVMRTELDNDSHSSDICCVDSLSGSVLSSYKLDPGETGKSMALVRVGNEQVLVVGTSLSTGPAIMPSGEAESTRGRLIILCLDHVQNSDSCSMTLYSKGLSYSQRAFPFREIIGEAAEQLSCSSLCSSPDDVCCDEVKLHELDSWQLRLAHTATLPGMVLAISAYLESYFLASAGNSFYVFGFANEKPLRMRRYAVGRTRFMITSLTAHANRIAVGDCRDGVLFFSYSEDQHTKKVEQLYCDPVQRLVADCVLMDVETAFVSDRKGSIAVLSASSHLKDTASPECNLEVSCSYYMGEVAMSVRKGSFSYKLPIEDHLKEGDNLSGAIVDSSNHNIMACTLLGSILIFIPISREEYKLLETVQDRLAVHLLTAPILGNNHKEFGGRESSAGVPTMLDGDMLMQFLELTSMQQEAILALPLGAPEKGTISLKTSKPVSMNEVVRLLERVHYALN